MKTFYLLFSFLVISLPTQAQLSGQLGILDVSANGGINPNTGLAWKSGDTYRLIFLSSSTRNASSTSISDYNSFVQSCAATAGHGSVNWYALVSTNSVDAIDNSLTSSSDTDGAILLMNGSEVVANNLADLWDGAVDTHIDMDETGSLSSISTSVWTPWTAVWTGTDNNGTATSTGYLGASTVHIGLARAELYYWENRGAQISHSTSLPVYGISEVLTVQETTFPVELTRLSVSEREGRVSIEWETATETNNDYFTVERSETGLQWHTIGRIEGAENGTSSGNRSYNLYDLNPIPGTSYYRLTQTDFDGQVQISQVVTLDLGPDFTPSQRLIYHPGASEVRLVGLQSDSGPVQVYTATGQDVTPLTPLTYTRNGEVLADLSLLKTGIYLISTPQLTHKLIKY